MRARQHRGRDRDAPGRQALSSTKVEKAKPIFTRIFKDGIPS
jgi:hypothetical protein